MGLNMKRYIPLYLQAQSRLVLQFVEEVMIGCTCT